MRISECCGAFTASSGSHRWFFKILRRRTVPPQDPQRHQERAYPRAVFRRRLCERYYRIERRHTMQSLDEINQPVEPIYNAALRCAILFDDCIGTESKGPVSLAAEELRSRFNQWAAYIGAFAAPRASLDARLASHSSTKDMVLELLAMVRENLQWGKCNVDCSHPQRQFRCHRKHRDSSLLPHAAILTRSSQNLPGAGRSRARSSRDWRGRGGTRPSVYSCRGDTAIGTTVASTTG